MSDPNTIDGEKMRFTGIDGEKRRAVRLTAKHPRHWALFFAINCSISKPFFAVNSCSASFYAVNSCNAPFLTVTFCKRAFFRMYGCYLFSTISEFFEKVILVMLYTLFIIE